MLTDDEIKDIIDSYKLEETIPRKQYTNEIFKYFDRKEIIVLKGIRRCGKSTIMKQLMSQIGVRRSAYINLDDYRFLENRSVELLEKILKIYGDDEKIYLFLDEIQNIPSFESWLRTHYDMGTNVKFIVSGSNSTIMTKEMGTLLTGRCINFEIKPLDYSEFLTFSGEDIDGYLRFGGFPEVVLEKDEEKKKKLLLSYFDTIVDKDIIQKHDVVNHRQLKEMLKFLILNPGIRISANKLSKQLGISINTVKTYLSMAQDAYLIFEVPFFSYSAKTKFIGSRISKYYSIDNGFFQLFSTRYEISKLFENSVALHFFPSRSELYYWSGDNEVDFVFKDLALNVVSSKKIPQREFRGLEEIPFKQIERKIIISPIDDKEKGIISLERFLKGFS